MKFLRMIWLLGIFFFGLLDNVAAQDKPRCVEYKISKAPVQCGPGYTGMKIPVVTFTCPDRRQVESFDTTGCIQVGTPPKNPLATNCAVTPNDAECMPLPRPSGCPAGKHWTTQGSGIAHCVGDDMNCPWGQTLTHDALGNPSCVPNSCPSNQVLQADGKSCACPPGSTWNGASCVVPAAFCPPKKVTAINCPLGMPGQGVRTTTYTLPNCTEQVSDDFSQCNRNECPPPSSVTSACPAGQTGSIVTTTSYVGVACTPVTNSTDNCYTQPPQCPSDSQQQIACPAGFTGSALLKTTYDKANNCARTDTIDNSGCNKKTPTYTFIEPGQSNKQFGIIGTNDLCKNGEMIIPFNGSVFQSGTICNPGDSPGSDRVYFSFVPRTSFSWFAAQPWENPRTEDFVSCIFNGYSNNGYNCGYLQDYRDHFLNYANGNVLFVGLSTISNPKPMSATAFVREGEPMAYYWSERGTRPIPAPSDGYIFQFSFCRCGD